jgi:hypothetical protein
MDDNVIARNYRKAWNPTQMCNRIFLPCLVDTYFFPRLRWHWPDTNTHTHISINIIDIRTMCIPVDIIIRHTYVTVQHGGIELTILSFDFQNEVLNRKTTKRNVMLGQGSHNLRSLYNQWMHSIALPWDVNGVPMPLKPRWVIFLESVLMNKHIESNLHIILGA